ncbi:MAG: hypothetical protein FJ189_11930, partial [Gammaproteobacteria bacterium]|nr:hypothetical protein [Gammaproteobacteria bacterium]
ISPTLEAESALQQILLARPRLERILPADSGRALGLGFSPDAQWLAVGLGDGSALIWNLDDGRPAQRLATDGSGYADAVAFDSALTLAAVSGSNRNAVTVRRLADGAATADFAVQDGSPSQKLLFAPDGKSLARVGGSQAAGVIVWDLATGKPRFPPLAVDSDLSALALSPDGSRIAAGGWSPKISIWDAATGAPRESRKQIGAETFTVHGLALGPQPGWLAAAAGDGVQLFDLAHPGKKPDRLLPGNDRAVRSVAIDPTGHWLAAGYEGGGLRLWGLTATDRPGESLDGEGSYVDTLAFSSDGSRLASGGYDQAVRVFSTGGIARFGRLLGRQKDAIAAVAFSPDGEWIAAGGRERVVGLWRLAGGEGHQAAAHRSDIRALAFAREGLLSADARILPNLQSLVAVLRWRLDGGPPTLASPPPPELPLTGLMAMFPDQPALRDTPWPVALSADGQRLARLVPPAFGSVQIRIEIVATADDRVLATLVPEHTHNIVALAFSGDGHRLGTAGADGRFEVWDAARGQRLAADRVGENRSCQAVALSADGSHLAVGCGRDLAVVWDLDGATHAQTHLDGHASDITALALDTSGRRLAAADRDSGWTLWDIESGRAVG